MLDPHKVQQEVDKIAFRDYQLIVDGNGVITVQTNVPERSSNLRKKVVETRFEFGREPDYSYSLDRHENYWDRGRVTIGCVVVPKDHSSRGVATAVLEAVAKLEIHEMLENFYQGDVRTYDPHSTGQALEKQLARSVGLAIHKHYLQNGETRSQFDTF